MKTKNILLTILTSTIATTSCFNYCTDTKRNMLDTAIKISAGRTIALIAVQLITKESIIDSTAIANMAQVAIAGALGRLIVGPIQNIAVAGGVGVAALSGAKIVKNAAQISKTILASIPRNDFQAYEHSIGVIAGAMLAGAGAACMTTLIIATCTRTPIPLAIAAGTTIATYGMAQTSNMARDCVGMGIKSVAQEAAGGALEGIIGALVVERCKTIYNKYTQPKPSNK